MLIFPELEEKLLSIECFMNNRSLSYVREEFEKPAITRNILIRGERTTFIDENVEMADLTKKLKFLKRCKEQLQKR